MPDQSVSVGLSAAVSVRGQSASLSGSEGTVSATCLVAQPEIDQQILGMQSTSAMRLDIIVKRSAYPGTPSLGDTAVITFDNGATKSLKVVAEDGGARVFRHCDPSGEFLRVHAVVTASSDVTTTTAETTTTAGA